MVKRLVTPRVLEALRDRPVVVLEGPRQAGKSTLARSLADHGHPARYLTLDDNTVLGAARSDPSGFVAGLSGNTVIDEAQLAPELFPAIKASVDRDRRPGRFLLTGSANALFVPGLARALVGRMEMVTLWPFGQAEMARGMGGFLSRLMGGSPVGGGNGGVNRGDLAARMVAGGYPEAVRQVDDDRRHAWFRSYISTIIQRDVRELADIGRLAAVPQLLGVVAGRATGLLNYADLSRSLGMPQSTLKRYLALLEAVFMVQPLPAWARNTSRRLIRAPKVLVADTGLLCHLVSASRKVLLEDPVLFGHILENFVSMEVFKMSGWSRTPLRVTHYRDAGGREVDLVVETPDGDVVGIEVKSAGQVDARDFRGLKALAEAAGRRFRRGVVLYTGRGVVPFGKDLHAVPLDAIWR
jgi:predicted AAA+ superfamily ATPase